MVALAEFVNQNPSWDIKKFLKSESKGLQKYINMKLSHGKSHFIVTLAVFMICFQDKA